MSSERTLVVAVEDLATAGVVAVEAAHVAISEQAGALVLLHVLDEHAVLCGMFSMANYAAPVVETCEECEGLLALAEEALRAEFAALDKPVPAVRHVIVEGPAAAAIQRVAAEVGAIGIVLGARRPHAFGRLAHPDVRATLAGHGGIPIHVAALQAAPVEQPTAR